MRQARDRSLETIFWVVGIVFAAGLTSVAHGSTLETTLGRELQHAGRGAGRVGVHVVEVGSGDTVFAHRADERLILASNTKILTTAAALDGLGPGHFVETPLLVRGHVDPQTRTLEGDVAVVGGGDPTFSGRLHMGDPFGVFRRWAARLRLEGIERITGDLILDHGLFPGPRRHPGWNPANDFEWYQAPVAALGFYENVVRIRLTPAEQPGAPARAELYPPVPFLEVSNEVRTLASRRGHRVEAVLGGDGVLRLAGGVYRGTDPVDTYLALEDPVGWFGAALHDALDRAGVHVDGQLRRVEALPGFGWRQLAVYRTDLLTWVEVTNRESQNFFAESLVRVLGAELCGRGTWEKGIRAVEAFLTEAGLEAGSYSLADGSGLARANRMAPRQMTTVLRHMAFHRWNRELMRSLPHGGQEGTSLEERLTEPAYADNVFAKTGTLNGVTTLSGYAKGRSGRLYAFSILVNGGPVWRGRKLQDALVRRLVDEG